MVERLKIYFQTGMEGFPTHSSVTGWAYLLEGVLLWVSVILWLEFADMGETYELLFPPMIAGVITFEHFLFTDVVSRLVYRTYRPFDISIAGFWLLSGLGIIAGFAIFSIVGMCENFCRLTHSYCPVMWQSTPPSVVSIFLRIILVPWLISTVLATFNAQKRHLALELAEIKAINDDLLKRKPIEANTKVAEQTDTESQSTNFGKLMDTFEIQIRDGEKPVGLNQIYFISVEDHYCKITFEEDGDIKEEMIRLSLKEAMEKLPMNRFAQIHRSHIVNLIHVKQIKKEGQSYQLFISGPNRNLPASRHRISDFMPKLRQLIVN